MGILRDFLEYRAEQRMVQFEDGLLEAILGGGQVSKEMAMQIPTVSGGIDLIAGIVAGTPIKLYRDRDGKAEEVKDDRRVKLLNDDTGDTLNANEFWRAMIRDYYTGKGGYAYINKVLGTVESIHYVKEEQISILRNDNPIFKDYDIQAGGGTYRPWDFLKILRNTRDGIEGQPVTKENSELIAAAYQSLKLEYSMAKRGGNKRGFLQSEKRLDDPSMDKLKASFRNLYTEGKENAIVLNNGVKFQESSATAAEMQLNENKKTNAAEFAKVFHISAEAISGGNSDISAMAKLAAIPLMQVIQCALNRDLLLEREKGEYYWAFDTKELLKGETLDRYKAYETALNANFMQIDEVRYAEDLPPLGLKWIKLGLQDVLYDPDSKLIYTPNTNQTRDMQEQPLKEGLQENNAGDIIKPEENRSEEMELRYNPYHDRKGRFTTATGGSSKKDKHKYAPSSRRNAAGITIGAKSYARLTGLVNTRYPNLKPEHGKVYISDAKNKYLVSGDGSGSVIIHKIQKL